MFFGPLCQRQRDQFWPVVHPHLQRVSAVYHDSAQHPDDSLSRDIQIDFYRQWCWITHWQPLFSLLTVRPASTNFRTAMI